MKFKPTNKTGGVLVELGPHEPIPMSPTEPAAPTLSLFKLKRILVPVDFSECSDKALQYAIPFAKQFDAELTLLHVVQPYPVTPEMYTIDMLPGRYGKEDLEALANIVPDSVQCKTVLRSGTPHIEIVGLAKELSIDLLILSTHGRTGLARAILGSTAEQVVRHAPCPVLVVRRKEQEFVA